MKQNYGKKDPAAESRVKEVFNQLKLDEDYYAYEDDIVGKLKEKIEQVDESRGFKREVLTAFLNKIYKRSK
jgi:farnesyl diphosphate synthase